MKFANAEFGSNKREIDFHQNIDSSTTNWSSRSTNTAWGQYVGTTPRFPRQRRSALHTNGLTRAIYTISKKQS